MKIKAAALCKTNLNQNRRAVSKRVTLLLMALPFLTLVVIFNYVPLFGWTYAFFDYKPGIPLSDTAFAGLKYFREAVGVGSELGRVLVNTLALSFLGILTSPLPVIFAILLSEVKNSAFKRIVQTTTTLPNFISWVIVYSLCFAMFSSQGLLNQILDKLGLLGEQPTNILGNNSAVWFFQTAIGIWKGLGWGAIIYLAAISGIDQELFDAAKVDGAGRLRRVLHITVPGVMPTYFVLLILAISNLFTNDFEKCFVFFNPLVADKLEVLEYHVYRMGILLNDYPYGTAIGMSKTLISITLLFSVNFLSKKVRGQSIV